MVLYIAKLIFKARALLASIELLATLPTQTRCPSWKLPMQSRLWFAGLRSPSHPSPIPTDCRAFAVRVKMMQKSISALNERRTAEPRLSPNLPPAGRRKRPAQTPCAMLAVCRLFIHFSHQSGMLAHHWVEAAVAGVLVLPGRGTIKPICPLVSTQRHHIFSSFLLHAGV